VCVGGDRGALESALHPGRVTSLSNRWEEEVTGLSYRRRRFLPQRYAQAHGGPTV